MGDFSYSLSTHRDEGGSFVPSGNPKAAAFVGTAISKWDTASATTLYRTFYRAGEMNADLSGWKVGNVVTLEQTFIYAYKFTGTGLASWGVARVTSMHSTFLSTTSFTTCNKRKIADAWKSSAVFTATSYDEDWAADTCTVRFERMEMHRVSECACVNDITVQRRCMELDGGIDGFNAIHTCAAYS